MPRVGMHDIDPKAFLALTHLARDKGALEEAKKYFPEYSDGDLIQLAREVVEYRDRALLGIAVKVPPTRRVSCWSEDGVAVLECGHTSRIRPSRSLKVARCRRCLREENRQIAENISGKASHAARGARGTEVPHP